MFVNALKSSDYEVLYLTETWLTLDILLAVLLLNAQRIYQKTENQPTKINKTWLSISIGGDLMEPVWSYPANAEQYGTIKNLKVGILKSKKKESYWKKDRTRRVMWLANWKCQLGCLLTKTSTEMSHTNRKLKKPVDNQQQPQIWIFFL